MIVYKKQRLLLFLAVVGLIFINAGCSNATFVGYVVDIVEEQQGSYRILVIRNLTEKELEIKSEEELIKMAQEKNSGSWFSITRETYDSLHIQKKDRVKVIYSSKNPVQTSDPLLRGAKEIEILN